VPSPIAHLSLAVFIWPSLKRRLGTEATPARRLLLVAMLATWLLLPDFDLLAGPLLGRPLMHYHNGPSHSLIAAVVMGVPFALICRGIAPGPAWRFFGLGVLAYASHVLLDAVTWGRGVQALWPITDARFASPVPLFFGIRHSVNAPYHWHLVTIVTELCFAVLLVIAYRWRRGGASARHASQTPPTTGAARQPARIDEASCRTAPARDEGS
jgi:membrane-bound metal-dependent hydrolase YbcI (DUF457 family)